LHNILFLGNKKDEHKAALKMLEELGGPIDVGYDVDEIVAEAKNNLPSRFVPKLRSSIMQSYPKKQEVKGVSNVSNNSGFTVRS